MNEIFIGIKDKAVIEAEIDALCDKYNNRQVPDYSQRRALFRTYCHDTIVVFESCFETSLLGMKKCINKVKAYQEKDIIETGNAALDIYNMLIELKSIVKSMVPIKDLPSCKRLTELSPEVLISKAKDLVKSDIIKTGASAVLLGVKIGDLVGIAEIRRYYDGRLAELTEEIKEKGGEVSPIECFLIDKFNAEIGYCDVASFKTGIGITEELIRLAEIGRKHIEKYENRLKKGFQEQGYIE